MMGYGVRGLMHLSLCPGFHQEGDIQRLWGMTGEHLWVERKELFRGLALAPSGVASGQPLTAPLKGAIIASGSFINL